MIPKSGNRFSEEIMAEQKDGYDFRPVTEKDLPMIAGWLAEPHVAQWWDDPETEIAEIRDHIDSISVEPLIVELDGKPIAYLQSYDPHLEDDHPYADQPFGTLGIDLTIGRPELVGIGHGSAIVRQFVEQLFEEGVPRVIIDPDPANGRAIRAYEKAGFRPIDRRQSEYGDVVLMAVDAEEGDTEERQ
jgi:aminoglycoside 6'-N-acetyltransferase